MTSTTCWWSRRVVSTLACAVVLLVDVGPSGPVADGATTGPAPGASPVAAAAGSDVVTVGPVLAAAGSDAVADRGARRGFWYAIGDTPTREEVLAAPARYGVVVLNPWETWALELLKATDPTVTVLVYKDLSSTRSYHRGPLPPAGVGVEEADANPGWYAVDAEGRRIEWDPYPGHWQMAVWDPDYRSAWTAGVVEEVVGAGWDGVLADNDMATLGWYDDAVLAGTTSREQSDALLRSGLDALVAEAGERLGDHGKLLVPNVSEARLHPGRWAAHSAHGGAMEEAFVHWGTDPTSGFLWDWGVTGWVTQTEQVASPGLSLAVTRAAGDDARSLLYGYASVLVRGGPDDLWTASTTTAGDYTVPETVPEMALQVGRPVGPAVRAASGVWSRTLTTGWAAVNPTRSAATVAAPRGATDVQGRRVRTLVLPPTSGVVLRVP